MLGARLHPSRWYKKSTVTDSGSHARGEGAALVSETTEDELACLVVPLLA